MEKSVNTRLLEAAAEKRSTRGLLAAIKRGADVNTRGGVNRTALIWATFLFSEENMKVLLAAGADITLEDNTGKTALDYAKERGFAAAQELLEAAAEGKRPSREEVGLEEGIQSAIERIRNENKSKTRGV